MDTKCQAIRERMDPYLEGDLDEAEEKEVERHVAECEQCLWKLEALRAETSKGLDESNAQEAGEGQVSKGEVRASWARRLWPAAAAVLIALALHFFVPDEADRPPHPEEPLPPRGIDERAPDPLDQELRPPVAITVEATVYSDDPSDTQALLARFGEDLGLLVEEDGEVLEGSAPSVQELVSRIEGLDCRVEIEDPAEGIPQEGWVRIALTFETEE